MATVHASAIVLYASLAGNLFLAVVAGGYAVGRRPLPSWYWRLIAVVVALVGLQVVAGLVLVLGGSVPRRGLHLMYGALAAVTGAVEIALRPGGGLRRRYAAELAAGEARILALVTLTAFALIARAWMTGIGVR